MSNDIPADAIQAINSVIENDEGGWKLTANPNDTDGGWTYAGVTAKTFNEYTAKNWPQYPSLKKNEVEEIINNPGKLATFKPAIYEIYYEKYYKPLHDWLGGHDYKNMAALLSCSINCGFETMQQIALSAMKDDNDFCNYWHNHYIELVKKNAEAWRDYALASEACLNEALKTGTVSVPAIERPKTLRAEFLAGWINRVERYRQ